ncbi:hypothetical protein Dimus_036229, partial [Dionaea muscipula]
VDRYLIGHVNIGLCDLCAFVLMHLEGRHPSRPDERRNSQPGFSRHGQVDRFVLKVVDQVCLVR